MSAISIGKHIGETLKNSAAIQALGVRVIRPVAVTQETSFPYIVYIRNSSTPETTKDGVADEQASVSILIAAKQYEQGIDIAEAVRTELEGVERDYEWGDVVEALFTGSADSYDEAADCFAIQLNFDFFVN